MTLGDWLVVAMAIQCVVAAAAYFCAGKYGFALAFAGYTIANIGLLWAART